MDALGVVPAIESASRAQRRREAARAKLNAMTKEERKLARRKERRSKKERGACLAYADSFRGWEEMPTWDLIAAAAANLEAILPPNSSMGNPIADEPLVATMQPPLVATTAITSAVALPTRPSDANLEAILPPNSSMGNPIADEPLVATMQPPLVATTAITSAVALPTRPSDANLEAES